MGGSGSERSRAVLYRFGEFELDAAAYTLTRGGEQLALQPKVFDLLRLPAGAAAGRSSPRRSCSTRSGSASTSAKAPCRGRSSTRAARSARSRGAREPIETVPGRGYRLIESVEVVPASNRSAGARAGRRAALRRVGTARGALPFVGRSEVMARLEVRLARGAARRGRHLPAGRRGGHRQDALRRGAARAGCARGVRTWSGRSVEGLGAPVFWPWIQVLREAVRERRALAEAGEALLSRMAALDAASASRAEQGAPQGAAIASGCSTA